MQCSNYINNIYDISNFYCNSYLNNDGLQNFSSQAFLSSNKPNQPILSRKFSSSMNHRPQYASPQDIPPVPSSPAHQRQLQQQMQQQQPSQLSTRRGHSAPLLPQPSMPAPRPSSSSAQRRHGSGDTYHSSAAASAAASAAKPFQCDKCVKSFGTKTDLNKYRKGVHEKLKPFRCNICGLAFGYKFNLNTHLKAIHGIDTSNPNHMLAQANKQDHLSHLHHQANPQDIIKSLI